MSRNGGLVSSTSGFIGDAQGSNGTVTVDNSTWTSTGSMVVGNAGTGILNVLGGGTVTNANAFVGEVANASGTVTVDGRARPGPAMVRFQWVDPAPPSWSRAAARSASNSTALSKRSGLHRQRHGRRIELGMDSHRAYRRRQRGHGNTDDPQQRHRDGHHVVVVGESAGSAGTCPS